MTNKEQQLILAILRWDNAEAPEAALTLVKGIDQQLNRFHKKMLSYSLEKYDGERNDENRIELDSFIPYMREECRFAAVDLTEFLIMLAFYHLHPQQDDNYLKFNESLGGFDPSDAEERMQDAVPFFVRGISLGSWQLKEYPDELRRNKQIVLEILKKNGSELIYVSEELRSDKEVVLEAVKQNGRTLYNASNDLKSDKEVVLVSVRNDAIFLNYASESLKSDKKIPGGSSSCNS